MAAQENPDHLSRLLLSASIEPWHRTLATNLRDTLTRRRVAPLELTSKPVAVKDIWGDYRFGGRAGVSSVLVHTLAITLLFTAATSKTVQEAARKAVVVFAPANLADYLPQPQARKDAGGGGGDRSPLPASLGRAPKASNRQFTPPMAVLTNINPQLPVEPTLVMPAEVKLPKIQIEAYGDPFGAPGPPSNGPGSGGGIGSGTRGGVGPGEGPGLGPGRGGGMSGTGRFAGGVKAPVALLMVEPDYSEEARKAKFQGLVVLRIVVDETGRPRNPEVVQHLGLGLDEKAIEAVQKWRFRPAEKDGKPVPVTAVVEVRFRLL